MAENLASPAASAAALLAVMNTFKLMTPVPAVLTAEWLTRMAAAMREGAAALDGIAAHYPPPEKSDG